MSHHKNGFSRALASRLATLLAPVALCAGLLASPPASAATMTGPVSGWQMGTEPSYITMYEYIPDTLAPNPPILVTIHYCGGNASGILGEASSAAGTTTSIKAKADAEGFIILLPQLNGRNCWDVATTAALTHQTGTTPGGDTKAIVDMVKYTITRRNANANRVYAIGSSSGAMMTEALLAVYPDVFKGGAEFAGVPAGCWSASYTESNQWSGPCAGGQVTKTAQQWGDQVRAMFAGYNGFRPRIQLWHGTNDTTINFNNQTEAVKQWTNVMGLTGNGTATTVTVSGHSFTRTQWMNSCGQTVLDVWTEQNGPHGTSINMNGQYTLPFMNLDTTPFAATDPQAGCGVTTGTGGSGGGAGGRGGTTGTAGTTGAGGRGGTTGTAGTTGTTGTAGTTGAGTAGTNGNTAGSAGTNGSSGQAGTNGSSGQAGTTGTTGEAGTTGTTGEAGTTGTTGEAGTTGTTGEAGTNGSGTGNTGGGGPEGPGCACETAHAPGAVNAFMLAGIIALAIRKRRTKRPATER